MARYIGVDLHRNRFTVCVLAENGREYLSEYRLEQLSQFVRKLRPTDELAVEVTGNTRLFHNAVASHVAKVVVVNPTQFKLIRQSVKKTDPHDARTLAFYLSKDMLPEVRMKDTLHAQLASLTQTRDTLVKQRTALKNKVNNILSAHGINLRKESLASDVALDKVLGMTFDAIVETLVEDGRIELRNFGVFEVKRRAPRKARNPRTGEKVDVAEKYVVTFKPGKEMEHRVRELERQAAARAAERNRIDSRPAAVPEPAATIGGYGANNEIH